MGAGEIAQGGWQLSQGNQDGWQNILDGAVNLGAAGLGAADRWALLKDIDGSVKLGKNIQNYAPNVPNTKNLVGLDNFVTAEIGVGNSIITQETRSKILEAQLNSKNKLIGGHSSNINNKNPNFVVEILESNSDGTKLIRFIKQLPDGSLSKPKISTVFPDNWSDSKIMISIKSVGESFPIGIRSDGSTLHRAIIDDVSIDGSRSRRDPMPVPPRGAGRTV